MAVLGKTKKSKLKTAHLLLLFWWKIKKRTITLLGPQGSFLVLVHLDVFVHKALRAEVEQALWLYSFQDHYCWKWKFFITLSKTFTESTKKTIWLFQGPSLKVEVEKALFLFDSFKGNRLNQKIQLFFSWLFQRPSLKVKIKLSWLLQRPPRSASQFSCTVYLSVHNDSAESKHKRNCFFERVRESYWWYSARKHNLLLRYYGEENHLQLYFVVNFRIRQKS